MHNKDKYYTHSSLNYTQSTHTDMHAPHIQNEISLIHTPPWTIHTPPLLRYTLLKNKRRQLLYTLALKWYTLLPYWDAQCQLIKTEITVIQIPYTNTHSIHTDMHTPHILKIDKYYTHPFLYYTHSTHTEIETAKLISHVSHLYQVMVYQLWTQGVKLNISVGHCSLSVTVTHLKEKRMIEVYIQSEQGRFLQSGMINKF